MNLKNMCNYSLLLKMLFIFKSKRFFFKQICFIIHSRIGSVLIQISGMLSHYSLWLYGCMPLWHIVNTMNFIFW